MLHIILYQPEIPQNTGNIGRLAAITNSTLHLIHPLGFNITDKHLRRSGMDYWKSLTLYNHDSFEDFLNSPHAPSRVFLFTTKSSQPLWNASFKKGDGLLFGNESSGCPQEVHDRVGDSSRLNIPHYNTELRSLNLATSVGIATYEAIRQITV